MAYLWAYFPIVKINGVKMWKAHHGKYCDLSMMRRHLKGHSLIHPEKRRLHGRRHAEPPPLLSLNKLVRTKQRSQSLNCIWQPFPWRIIHTMLTGSGELQLERIVLSCSYVITQLLKGDLEAVCRSNTAPVLCCPSRRFNVLSPTQPPLPHSPPPVPLSVFVLSWHCFNNR